PNYNERLNNIQHVETEETKRYHCPISYEVMADPITVASGISYDRESLTAYFLHAKTEIAPCPVTRENFINKGELTNKTSVFIKAAIEDFVRLQEKKHASESQQQRAQAPTALLLNPASSNLRHIRIMPAAKLTMFGGNQNRPNNAAVENNLIRCAAPVLGRSAAASP
ncbi:MAG: U-box domain-containing protein, partial [Legionellales bacterium]